MSSDAEKPSNALPRGLYLLFTAEMWERMSYYGMRALLVLYMTRATERGGFGWSRADALSVYGWYTAFVYITPLLGGTLADRVLGQRRAVLIGGSLMMVGHFLMAVPGLAAFYAALTCLVVGNGFFKPNISTMVGGLFKPGDPRRDAGYTVFYMGVNLGAALAPLVCGTLGEKLGFHWGFAAAGVGMLFGLLVFWWGAARFLGDIGAAPSPRPAHQQAESAPGLTSVDKDRLGAIFALAFFNIFFWAAFEQAGGLMTIYTDERIDRRLLGWEVPTSWFQALNPVFILMFGPFFARLWTSLARQKRDLAIPRKFGLGLALMGSGFLFMVAAARETAGGGKAALAWVVLAYLLHTVGELCISPIGLSMISKLAPPSMMSLLMGVWFGSIAIANKLAGVIGGYAEKLGEVALFGGLVLAGCSAGLVISLLSPLLVKKMHGAGE